MRAWLVSSHGSPGSPTARRSRARRVVVELAPRPRADTRCSASGSRPRAAAQPGEASGEASVVVTAYHGGVSAPVPALWMARGQLVEHARPVSPHRAGQQPEERVPSGVAWPFGYGPSVQPATRTGCGARSMFWTRSSIVRGSAPTPPGQRTQERDRSSRTARSCRRGGARPRPSRCRRRRCSIVLSRRPGPAPAAATTRPTRSSIAEHLRGTVSSGRSRARERSCGAWRTQAGLSRDVGLVVARRIPPAVAGVAGRRSRSAAPA